MWRWVWILILGVACRPAPAHLASTLHHYTVRPTPTGLDIGLFGDFADKDTVSLSLWTVGGVFEQSTTLERQASSLTFHFSNPRAGKAILIADVGGKRTTLPIQQGFSEATLPLQLKLGSRAVRVGGGLPSVVVHPLDQHKNVVERPMVFRYQSPARPRQTLSVKTQNLLAWTFVSPGNQIGKLVVSGQIDRSYGELAEVDILPGRATHGRLSVDIPSRIDGRDLLRMRLWDLSDPQFNRALDGTQLDLWGEGPQGSFQLSAPMVDGQSELLMPIDVLPGKYTFRARVEDWQTQKPFDVPQAATLQAPKVTVDGSGIHLGPLLNALGAVLDTGTRGTLTFFDPKGKALATRETSVEQGSIDIERSDVPMGTHRIEIDLAGVSASQVEIP